MADEMLSNAKVIVVPVGIGVYQKPRSAADPPRRQFPRLGEVANDIVRLRTLFDSEPYRRAGFWVADPIRGSYTSVRRKLTQLVQDMQGQPGKRLVVLWSGHAELIGNDDLRLATADSLTPMGAGDGWAPTELVNLLTDAKAQGLYLVLDVCQAGQVAGSLAERAAMRMKDEPSSRGRLPGFAVLCSALPYELAKDGLFIRVLQQVLTSGPSPEAQKLIAENGFGGFTFNRLLTPAELASVMQAEFDVRGRKEPSIQRPFPASVGADFPIFLNPLAETSPQPRRVDELGTFVSDLDAQSHFLPKARGLEPGEQGWNFTGRIDASRTLSEFIAGDSDDNLMVITGAAGVGKSAVIGRAVALSDPDFREALERTTRWSSDVAERQGTLPPANGIDAAVHLRGLTATGVAQRVTEILDLEPAGGDLLEDFVEQVLRGKDGNRRPTIVLDALDEAEEPRLIAERIVRPLVAAGCAVVIGTRPSAASHGLPNVLDLLGEGLRVDLSDDDSSEADIADYIDSRLTAADGPYAGDRALRRAISDAVTSRAQRQFLYAKLTTDELMAEPIASVAELELALTRSVGLAFARTLARLDAEFGQAFETAEPGATALALGLAWGEGLGVPVRNQIWPVVAQAVSRSPMLLTDEHCRWFFRKAGSYVLESGENEQAVYRLYHEALHEHLRQVTVDADSARRRIGMALFEHLRENGGWALANPYAVRHVPTSLDGETIMHLVAVCTDPFYLARALDVLGVDDTARLLDHVQRAAPNPALIATAKAVRRSRVALAHQASELAPQLIARLGSESDHALRRLVDTAKQVAPPIWLEPVNLRLEWSTELQTTQTLPGKVRSLAVWDMGADPRLFVGAGSSIVTWDARNGGVDRSFGNDDLRPLALAAGLLGSQDVVASGSYEGLAAVRDARTGALVAPRIVTGVTAWSVAVAPAPKHIPPEVEHEFSYAEHVWGRVLQLDGTCLYWSDLPNHLWVLDGRLAVVHETDDGFAVRTEGTDYEVHFAVERGLLPHEPVLAVANHLGQTHLAIAEDERTVRIIDPDGGSSVVQFNFPVRCLVLTWVGPEPVVAAANDSDRMFGTASYVSVRQPRAAVVPTEEDTTGRRLVGIAIQSGRLVGLRQDDWIIDIETGDGAWDPDATDLALVAGVRRPFEADRTAEDGMQDWPILSVGWASIDGQDVQIHGSTEGVVWLVDRERAVRAFGPAAPTSPARTPRRNPMAKGRELQSVRAVCAGTVAGHRQLARADAAGVILYDIDTGQSRPGPEVGQSRLSAMAFGSSGRRSLLATGSDGGGVAIWDCADWRRLTGFTLDDPITGIWLSESSVVVETDTMRPALFRLHGAATSNRT